MLRDNPLRRFIRSRGPVLRGRLAASSQSSDRTSTDRECCDKADADGIWQIESRCVSKNKRQRPEQRGSHIDFLAQQHGGFIGDDISQDAPESAGQHAHDHGDDGRTRDNQAFVRAKDTVSSKCNRIEPEQAENRDFRSWR